MNTGLITRIKSEQITIIKIKYELYFSLIVLLSIELNT